MRQFSVAVMKGRHSPPHHLVPTEGTKIRAVFDLFMANKGIPVHYKAAKGEVQLYYLRDFYGLDIRRVGPQRFVLAGEWFDTVYIDYIADRLK